MAAAKGPHKETQNLPGAAEAVGEGQTMSLATLATAAAAAAASECCFVAQKSRRYEILGVYTPQST